MRRIVPVLASLAVLAPVLGDAAPASASGRFVLAFDGLPADASQYAGEPVVAAIPHLRVLVVEARDAAQLRAHAAADPSVRYIEPDLEAMHASLTPDDPYFGPYQYDVKPGTTNVTAAWDRTLGSTSVKLCVIDTGQYRGHEDLQGLTYFFWKDEVAGKPGAYDDNGHGTHVTGTAAASLGNGKGIAGIAPLASIGAAKVLNKRGSGTWSAVAAGITDCADAGAHVASMSLGGGAAQVLQDAVQYALGKGVLIAAAAGNDGPCSDCVEYPAAYPGVTAVACSDAANAFCSFSSQGPQVDLLAPGKGIVSAWANTQPCTRPSYGHCYVQASGTSMSTPHVAGLAALYKSTHPLASGADIEAALKAGARDVGLPAAQQGTGLVQGAVV